MRPSGSIQLLAALVRQLAVEEPRARLDDRRDPARGDGAGDLALELPEHRAPGAHRAVGRGDARPLVSERGLVGFLVRPDENLFAWVWLSPQQTPPRR